MVCKRCVFYLRKLDCISISLLLAALGSLVIHTAVLAFSGFFDLPQAGFMLVLPEAPHLHFESRMLQVSEPDSASVGVDALVQTVEKTGDTAEEVPAVVGKVLPSPNTLSKKASERFYQVAEVTQPATPFADWLVPWEVLRQAQAKEFVVRLWILDTGQVLQADVLTMTPSDVSQSVKDELSNWLLRTRTNPAIRDGRAVASVRTIEVTLEL